MSDMTTESTAEDGAGTPLEGLTGDLDGILDALGLEPETPEERAGNAAPAKTAKVEAKDDDAGGEKFDAKADAEGKKKDPAQAERDAEIAELAAIRKKSRDRKAAAQARAAEPAPAAAKPAEAAPVVAAKPAEGAKPTPGESEVAAAVRDVVAQIAKLTADEEAAKPGDAGADARAASLKDLHAKIAEIGEKVGGTKALADEIAALRQAHKDAADQRFVDERIDETLTKMESKVPLLSSRRDAVAKVREVCVAFHQKTGKWPPLEFAASKAEAVLARREGTPGASPEKTSAKAGEKKDPKSKTVSSSLATPPSLRLGPDKRTPKEVEADLWKSLNIDPDA